MAAVAITRADHDAADLRKAASCSGDAAAARRMLALALVLDGHARSDAARLCGMDRQTLRDWVHRYNEEGLAGLSDRHGRRGPPRRLSAEQEAAVAALVRSGPDRAEHGVVRWRRVDLAAVIARRFDVHLAERTVGKLLRRLGFVRLSVRPRHPAHDAEAQAAHKKTSPIWSPRRSPSTPAASRSNSGGRTRHASASKAP
jgi:transposase